MKYRLFAVLIAAALVGSPAHAQRCDLVGAWEVQALTLTHPDGTVDNIEIKDPPGLKILSPTHWVFVEQNEPDHPSPTSGGGGTYTVHGTTYTEFVQYHAARDYVGETIAFDCRTEGDIWYQWGLLPDGVRLEEVYRRPRQSPVDSVVHQAAHAFYEAAPQAVGLSVGVVMGEEIRTYHFGTVDPARESPPTDQTLYGIASVTKTFTGTLLARAAQDGLLGVQDDVRNYLDGAYPNLAYQGQPITLAQLLNHTSGLPNSLPDRPEMYPDYPGYEEDVMAWLAHSAMVYDTYSRADFMADLHTVELDTLPGTRFGYSNAGAKLAGYVLEWVYDRPFEVLVDSLIAQPLGMVDTGISLDADEAQRLVTGYDETGQAMPQVPAAYGAAGALRSTVVDLARYVRWHLDETDPVILRAHTPPGGDAQQEGYAIGLNWQMLRHGGVRRIWQDGNVPGYSSRVVLYPDLDLGVVVLANQLDRSIPELTDQLADTILEALDERTFSMREGL